MAASKATQGAVPLDKKLTQGAWQEAETPAPAGGVEVAVLMHHYTHNMGRQ
jgi:hypothetical protein